MPFHIFLSQWLSTYTGGLDAWKIGKDVILFLLVIFSLFLIFLNRGFKDKFYWLIAGLSILYVAVHLIVWKLNPGLDNKTALLATVYNARIFGYFIVGGSAALILRDKLSLKLIFRLAVAISTVVCLLAMAQYLLPNDFMTHFGYSVERGVKPNFAIDDKPDLPRVFSTLRDPNSLGAYLILPVTLLAGAFFRLKNARMLIGGLALLHFLVIFLTFSRSAWAGTIIAIGLLLFWIYRSNFVRFVKKFWPYIGITVVALALFVFLARDQYVIQNIVFHSDENTTQVDSNNKHLMYAKDGAKSIIKKPLGHGPGTAGLVSIHNKKTVLTENYFIQVGYEVGIAGLVLMLVIMYLVIRRLVANKNFYSRALVSAFIGITFCCLLLHTWTNEAVAAQWWLLAGLAFWPNK